MTIVNAVEVVTSTTKPTNGNTLIHIALDETGSMNSCWDATITSFNDFIGSQKTAAAGDCNVSLTTFATGGYVRSLGGQTLVNGGIKDVFTNTPVADVPLLSRMNYKPNGGTNLYDAIGSTIRKIEAQLAPLDAVPNVLVVIITDGGENASTEFRLQDIQSLIKAKEQEGWTFIYLGANQDAWKVGSTFGLSKGQTVTYSTNDMSGTMNVLAEATTAYRGMRAQAFASGSTETMAVKGFFGDEGLDLTKK